MLTAGFKLDLPERARGEGFTGSNLGDTVSEIDLPDLAQDPNLWRLPWAKKKLAYGASNLPKVGGKTAGAHDSPLERGVEDEPFCFWSLPMRLLRMILKCYFVDFVIDLSPSDGRLYLACLQLGVLYLGM